MFSYTGRSISGHSSWFISRLTATYCVKFTWYVKWYVAVTIWIRIWAPHGLHGHTRHIYLMTLFSCFWWLHAQLPNCGCLRSRQMYQAMGNIWKWCLGIPIKSHNYYIIPCSSMIHSVTRDLILKQRYRLFRVPKIWRTFKWFFSVGNVCKILVL